MTSNAPLPKVPLEPPPAFVSTAEHLHTYSGALWRVYPTTTAHALQWNELRHFGPVEGLRFDPHPLPIKDHPEIGVMYAATQPYTAIAEVFQHTRVIARAQFGRTLVGWKPSRPLVLLDLTSNWPVMNGAAAAMMMDDKTATQAWARAIDERLGDEIDGLYHHSSVNNRPLVTLFSRAERVPAFPARPSLSVPLNGALADELIAQAVSELGYTSS